MSLIRVHQVTKLYGRFAALRQVSADFEGGRLYGIFGENGAGKSTLLRLLAGLAQPTSGTIEFDPHIQEHGARGSLGYMAHASMLYDEFSAMENLRYFGSLYGIHDERLVKNAIEQVGLNPLLERRVGHYSQGMRQRLSLARAFLHDPRILLLDEPFSNLDVNGAGDISRLLGTWRDAGKCILVVTHQIAQLERITDESMLLSCGEVAARAPGTGVLQAAQGAAV